MARNWISIINAPVDPPDWGIPPAQITDLITLFDAAQDILLKAQSDTERTKVVTAQCNAAFKALVKRLRFIKAHYFLMPPLTEADLIALGLKPPDTVHTPIPEPKAEVTADVALIDAHLIELRDFRPRLEHSPDPRSDHAVDIRIGIVGGVGPYAIDAPPDPQQGSKLPFARTTRRRWERFDLEGNSGKTVWFSLAYRNSSNQIGPFCPIFSAIIPYEREA
jgi:hypothetical protein